MPVCALASEGAVAGAADKVATLMIQAFERRRATTGIACADGTRRAARPRIGDRPGRS